MANPTISEMDKRDAQIRLKRMSTVLGAYDLMRQKYREVKKNTFLNKGLLAATVEDYLQDRRAIITRHNITGRIQRHKIAGLMAAAIVKNRPIQLIDAESEGISRDNEFFAVLHGLAICSEGNTKGMEQVFAAPHSDTWLSDFVYLLHRHPSNTESFILIFETLSLSCFSDNLNRLSEKK
ncbi:MAG TPA: hypothetical protein VGN23_14335 [Verrucomicrobiae bacterium]|jgi:hypothetical protein